MAKLQNLYLYGSPEELKRLKEEYELLGRPVKMEGDRLVVLTRVPKKPKRKKDENGRKGKSPRPTRD